MRGLRIGWDESFSCDDMEADYAQAVRDAVRVLEGLGAEIVPVTMPVRLRDYLPAWALLCQVEAFAAHRNWYPARAEDYGPFFRQWLITSA